MRIGIDIGNVIIGGGGEDTQFFGDDYLGTPEVKGAHLSIEKIAWNKDYTRRNEVHFISKCGRRTELRTMEWLIEMYRYDYIIDVQNIHFVRKRHLKAPMAQALELDIFIDDREDIIESMEGIVKHPILFTSWEQTNTILEGIFNDKA